MMTLTALISRTPASSHTRPDAPPLTLLRAGYDPVDDCRTPSRATLEPHGRPTTTTTSRTLTTARS